MKKIALFAGCLLTVLIIFATPLTESLARKGFRNASDPWAELAVMTAARVQMLMQQHALARQTYQTGIRRFSSFKRNPLVYYRIARCYEVENMSIHAAEWYESVCVKWPSHRLATAARRHKARLDLGATG